MTRPKDIKRETRLIDSVNRKIDEYKRTYECDISDEEIEAALIAALDSKKRAFLEREFRMLRPTDLIRAIFCIQTYTKPEKNNDAE